MNDWQSHIYLSYEIIFQNIYHIVGLYPKWNYLENHGFRKHGLVNIYAISIFTSQLLSYLQLLSSVEGCWENGKVVQIQSCGRDEPWSTWIILTFSRKDSGLGRNCCHRCGISQQFSILTSKVSFWTTCEGWTLETTFCGGLPGNGWFPLMVAMVKGPDLRHFIGGCHIGPPLVLLPILFNNWQKTSTVQSEVYQYADDIQLGVCIPSPRERW